MNGFTFHDSFFPVGGFIGASHDLQSVFEELGEIFCLQQFQVLPVKATIQIERTYD
jgi:hypothetical protein